MSKSSEAWTFGKSAYRASHGNSRVPGPGNYEVDFKRAQSARPLPSGKQHFQSKPSNLKNVVPGPGQYFRDPQTSRQAGVSMGHRTTSGSFMNNTNRTPGPGQYDPQASKVAKNKPSGGVIGFRPNTARTDLGVGPGQYETSKSILNPGFGKIKNKGFGSSGHTGIGNGKEKTPGPGSYLTINDKQTAVGFGTSTRKSGKEDGGVGPGQYLGLNTDMSKIGRNDITLKSRPKDASSNVIPGPGQYDPDCKVTKVACGGNKFPKSPRLPKDNGSKVPGPGHVNLNSEWDKSTISQGGWLKLDPTKPSDRGKAMMNNEKTPGPGAYSIKSDIVDKHGPKYSMQQRYKKENAHPEPGPGHYQPQLDGQEAMYKAVKIGTSERTNFAGGRQKEPGPGAYTNTDNKNSLSYSFSHATRIDSKSANSKQKSYTTPGPGAYKVPYYVAEVPSYVMQRPEEFKYR